MLKKQKEEEEEAEQDEEEGRDGVGEKWGKGSNNKKKQTRRGRRVRRTNWQLQIVTACSVSPKTNRPRGTCKLTWCQMGECLYKVR